MGSHKMQIRVRYSETDKMGYVYYGNYASYYEIGRVEMLRSLGIRYRDLEEEGVLLPVASMETKFIKPATYDELLTIDTKIIYFNDLSIEFEHKIYNEAAELLNIGKIKLVYIDALKKKVIKGPDYVLHLITKFTENEVV